ncbi:MAG: cupredoxin domain-containing protein [Mucilaginibacter polytrichastri]|nr:cupredoxin domain-containing protein [Mucilaginibacter polytrichastri]
MKYVFMIAALAVFCSCGQAKNTGENGSADTSEAVLELSDIPGADKLTFSDTILISANDDMQFDHDLFKIKSGKKVYLQLTNTGAKTGMPMAHNVVILRQGTDLSAFGEEARKFKDAQYIPATFAGSVIAHTKQVVAGASDGITFSIDKPGVYDFICSYPGHWGTMQGKIIVE